MTQTFIYKLHLKERYHQAENWDERTAEVFKEHFAYLSRASESGKAYIVGRTDVSMKDNFGIVIFEAKDENEARDFMNGDPCVVHGIMGADVYPFRLALWSRDGLEKAMASD